MKPSRVVINTASQIASRILVIFVSLVTTSFLTRFLGAEGFGNYIFVSSSVLVLVALTDLGTTIIGVREVSSQKGKAGEIFGNIFGLRLFLSLILFGTFNLLVFFLPQFSGLKQASFVASFVLFFLVLRTMSQAVLQSFLRLDIASLSEVFASLLFLGFLIIFYLFGKTISLTSLMLFWSISALLSGVAGLFMSAKYLVITPLFQKEKIIKILKESFPLGVYLLVYSVYDRGIDSFIIKTFCSVSDVGYYGLAYKIHGNLILGAAFLMNSLFPLISGLKKDPPSLKLTFEKAFTVLFLSGFLIFISGFFLAPLVVKLIAGSDFSPSTVALKILLLATMISYLNHLTGYLMVVLGEQKKLLSFSVVALFLNLFLNLIFIPKFSFLAAAWVTVLTEFSLLFFTQKYLAKKYMLKFSLEVFVKNSRLLFYKKANYFE